MAGCFGLSWLFANRPHPAILAAILGLIACGLFNVRGVLRPRRLTLRREGFDFRPVSGDERRVRWRDVEDFRTFTVTSLGSGYVRYRLRLSAPAEARSGSRSLGFYLQPLELIATLETWRQASR